MAHPHTYGNICVAKCFKKCCFVLQRVWHVKSFWPEMFFVKTCYSRKERSYWEITTVTMAVRTSVFRGRAKLFVICLSVEDLTSSLKQNIE